MTLNTGDFNSIRPEIAIEAEVEDGDDPAQVIAKLHSKCSAYLKKSAPSHLSNQVGIRAELKELLEE